MSERSRPWFLEPPWRTVTAGLLLFALLAVAWLLWSPGAVVRDGSHDLGTNGIWLSHGWLGADAWFDEHDKGDELFRYRGDGAVESLAATLRARGITDVYPHLAPAEDDGSLPPHDEQQMERFLAAFDGFRVLPWVGGVRGGTAFPSAAAWRRRFSADVGALMREHPGLAGAHLNIEPCPSGSEAFLDLLDEVRAELGDGGILSVAAYPPPTVHHPVADVHWDEDYFRAVAARSDQLAVMMYDTGLNSPKLYTRLLRDWTRAVLRWSGGTEILLGLPAYDDAGSGYHDPTAENLGAGLSGVHAGLMGFDVLPESYRGIALYCGWELDEAEWELLDTEFFAGGR